MTSPFTSLPPFLIDKSSNNKLTKDEIPLNISPIPKNIYVGNNSSEISLHNSQVKSIKASPRQTNKLPSTKSVVNTPNKTSTKKINLHELLKNRKEKQTSPNITSQREKALSFDIPAIENRVKNNDLPPSSKNHEKQSDIVENKEKANIIGSFSSPISYLLFTIDNNKVQQVGSRDVILDEDIQDKTTETTGKRESQEQNTVNEEKQDIKDDDFVNIIEEDTPIPTENETTKDEILEPSLELEKETVEEFLSISSNSPQISIQEEKQWTPNAKGMFNEELSFFEERIPKSTEHKQVQIPELQEKLFSDEEIEKEQRSLEKTDEEFQIGLFMLERKKETYTPLTPVVSVSPLNKSLDYLDETKDSSKQGINADLSPNSILKTTDKPSLPKFLSPQIFKTDRTLKSKNQNTIEEESNQISQWRITQGRWKKFVASNLLSKETIKLLSNEFVFDNFKEYEDEKKEDFIEETDISSFTETIDVRKERTATIVNLDRDNQSVQSNASTSKGQKIKSLLSLYDTNIELKNENGTKRSTIKFELTANFIKAMKGSQVWLEFINRENDVIKAMQNGVTVFKNTPKGKVHTRFLFVDNNLKELIWCDSEKKKLQPQRSSRRVKLNEVFSLKFLELPNDIAKVFGVSVSSMSSPEKKFFGLIVSSNSRITEFILNTTYPSILEIVSGIAFASHRASHVDSQL